ncbi:MAG: AMP-binding protein [gamma proteobacterium symbiont of Lucinoma myriamae]|nr:AMP-binding protein [gamma proteobacterium symbiont of Lucinoma myriamae]
MTSQTDNKNKSLKQTKAADLILQIVNQLALEMHHGKQPKHSVNLDSMLDRDLQLDSLSRVELLQRIERKFKVRLPEKLLATAETPGDLLQGVMNAPDISPGIHDITKISGIEMAQTEAIETNPDHVQTLTEVLQWHLKKHPQRPHIYLYGDEDVPLVISYADLFEGAKKIAAGLQDYGVESGQTVTIMLPTGEDYLLTYFAILLVGAIPVPIYPPTRPSQLEEHLRRHAKILNNADTVLLITVKEAKIPGQLLKAQVSNLRHVLVVDELREEKNQYVPIPVQGEDIAFLQYTSGSTGTPKGVVLTHNNLLANIRAMGQVVQASSNDVFVSWLPLYHDMGLIGAWLGSLYYASPLVLMSPLTFLTHPSRWLWAIHKHKGTLSAAPNFAYEFCLSKIQDDDIKELDLSSWRMAFNGAEPVNPKALRDFASRFKHYGFHSEALSPVYGLAESAVGLAFPPPGRGALIDCVQRDALQLSGIAQAATQEQSKNDSCLEFAACGQPLPGYQIRIVDPSGRELPERREGRLQFQGPSATSGYFHNPAQTRQLFDGEWLETGDLAYMAAGDIYLTGRSKEIIIRAGRNIYPYEIEQAVGKIPGIRKGCVAVFGTHDKGTATERIVVLAETRESDEKILQQLHTSVDLATSGILLGSSPDEILLLPPHSVLKTSSGKVRRTACRDLYEQGQINRSHRSIGLQLLRVAATSIKPQLAKLWHKSHENLFALWAWITFSILAPITWFTVILLPLYSWRRGFIRKVIQLFCLMTGTPLRVYGVRNLPSDKSVIFVCNHASYVDGIILMAALPESFSFVAKKELEEKFIPRLFLQRIGSIFVERFDIQRGAADAKVLQEQVKKGHSLVIFPEGTFTRITGLRPFRMGAFTTAAQADKAVIPVTLRGTRTILGAATWYPRQGTISVNISKPIYPHDSGWNEAIRLRDEARLEILNHYDEPDLAQ